MHVVDAPVQAWEVEVQPFPLFFSITIPEWNPLPLPKLTLQGPHHAAATYWVLPIVIASSAVT